MPASSCAARPALPAFVLALVLLGALALSGWQVLLQLRMAPGTLIPAEALTPKSNGRNLPTTDEDLSPEMASGPGWEMLGTPQKVALYPLAERWALLSAVQKRHWLALAESFHTLPESEQSRLYERMTAWASLSTRQRSQARLNYADTKRLAPDDKLAQWKAYQALSDEEKRKLLARAAPKPQGAAMALRPVSPRKLAQVPAATQANPNRPNPPKIPPMQGLAPHMATPPLPAPVASPAPASVGNVSPEPTSQAHVETAPVNVPVAVPTTLPPLPASPPPSDAASPHGPDTPSPPAR